MISRAYRLSECCTHSLHLYVISIFSSSSGRLTSLISVKVEHLASVSYRATCKRNVAALYFYLKIRELLNTFQPSHCNDYSHTTLTLSLSFSHRSSLSISSLFIILAPLILKLFYYTMQLLCFFLLLILHYICILKS